MLQRRHFNACWQWRHLLSPWATQAQTPNTVLRFAWWGGAARHEATLKAIALFEQQNPGLKIKAEYMGFQRLSGAPDDANRRRLRAGHDADQLGVARHVFQAGQRLWRFGPVQYRTCWRWTSSAPKMLRTAVSAGKLNALPTSYSARVFLWNQASFARAGMPVAHHLGRIVCCGQSIQSQARRPAPIRWTASCTT